MEFQTKEERELEIEVYKIAKEIREMKHEEVIRLTKIYLQNELHKKKDKESMYVILCMIIGKKPHISSWGRGEKWW